MTSYLYSSTSSTSSTTSSSAAGIKSSSSSKVAPAKRDYGVCRGCLYRSCEVPSTRSSLTGTTSTTKVYEFCTLVGIKLTCYESHSAYESGKSPTACFNIVGASSCVVGSSSFMSKNTSSNDTFRLVTNQGKHLLCTAPSSTCREVWLNALNQGLERDLQEQSQLTAASLRKGGGSGTNPEDDDINNLLIMPAPAELNKVRPRIQTTKTLSSLPKYCQSCGKVERLEFPLSLSCSPLPQHGYEERVDLCKKCLMAQGIVDHITMVREFYAASQQEHNVLVRARMMVLKKLQPSMDIPADQPMTNHVTLTSLSHHVLLQAFLTSEGSAMLRISPALDELYTQFSQGMIGVSEFLEMLEHEVGIVDPQLAQLKKQAFRVAGDMGTALKLLHENALPGTIIKNGSNNAFSKKNQQNHSNKHNNNTQSVELLQCILEFFLDLLEEGELNTVAFFWPQLCNIHLQMLPPVDASSLIRIELMEDFLLTVATKYSIHLATELIWSHAADLEETHGYCLKRRPAVLRFLCELESLLFDFESGWGGGSVTVGSYLTPSNNQIHYMKLLMQQIQTYRLHQTYRLSTSRRWDKILRYEIKGQSKMAMSLPPPKVLPPEIMAQEALRVAKNADYLSTHMAFTKRLCDIAEKLRFLPVESRPKFLQSELVKLNASGTMGGDPLNHVKNDHTRVVRIPTTEGHVFRSKERTPVLLLVELLDEGFEKSHQQINPNEEVKQEKDQQERKEISSEAIVPPNQGQQEQTQDHVNGNDETTEDEKKETKDEGEDNVISHVPTNDETNVASAEAAEKEAEKESGDGTNDNVEESNTMDDSNDVKPASEVTENGSMTTSTTEEGSKISEDAETTTKEEGEQEDAATDKDTTEGGTTEQEGTAAARATEDGEAAKDAEKVQDEEETTTKTDVDAPTNDDKNVDTDDKSLSTNTMNGTNHSTTTTQQQQEQEQKQQRADAESVTISSEQVQKVDIISETYNHDSKDILSGSLEGFAGDVDNVPRHALRRFDSPKGEPRVITPTADKMTVEALVGNVVAKQLQLPQLKKEGETMARNETPIKDVDSTMYGAAKSPDESSSIFAKASKLSTLSTSIPASAESGGDVVTPLSKTGERRREVLNTIMEKGLSGSHTIAAGAATAMQRHLQDLERRRAVGLLLAGDDRATAKPTKPSAPSPSNEDQSNRQELLSLGIRSVSNDDLDGEKYKSEVPSEEDDVMESLRLLLIQNKVAQGSLSLNDAAAVLAPRASLKQISNKKTKEGTIMHFGREFPEIDAGDVDTRLVGCGTLPPAVLQALTLWKANMITNGELLELVKKDIEFQKNSVEMEESKTKLNENSAFWGRFAFGERWNEKRSRIAAKSPEAALPGWDLIGIIVKSNDDLRQEAFVMQLIELCREAFQEAGLELWLLPYRILSTGRTTGIIEMVRNAMSFDALKKRPGYGRGGLREHLHRMTQFAADPGEAFKSAQRNFVKSLAAYSLLSFLFLFKDRHNGNILLDTAGHVIHIDFGFVFGVAPGGSFSLEMSTPFKLTEEMIDVMDGLRSELFSEFVTLFCCGFLALQAHCDTFLTIVEITSKDSTFKCFEGRGSSEVVDKLRDRFRPHLDSEATIAYCLDIIKDSTQSYGTAQYDYFQYLSQGIAA